MHVFEFVDGVWDVRAHLTPVEVPTSGGGFGRSVAIHGTTIVVGAESDQLTAMVGADRLDKLAPGLPVILCQRLGPGNIVKTCPRPGAAHVFERFDPLGAWVQVQRLQAPDGWDGDGFGSAVAIGDGVLVAGAPRRDLGTVGTQVQDLTGVPLGGGFAYTFVPVVTALQNAAGG